MRHLIFTLVLLCGGWFGSQAQLAVCDTAYFTLTINGSDVSCTAQQYNRPGYTFYYYWNDGTQPNFTGGGLQQSFSFNNGAQTVYLRMSIQDSLGAEVCNDTFSQSFFINYTGGCNLSAGFTYNVYPDNTVEFNPFGIASALNYLWDFGDGTTSTDFAPTHQYSGCAYYMVSQQVSDNATCIDWASATIPIGQIDGGFQPMQTGPLDIVFNGSVSTPYDSIYWDFGDGTSSTDLNPQHTYQQAGRYIAVATVYAGSCTVDWSYTVTIPQCDMIADFYFGGANNLSVTLEPRTYQYTSFYLPVQNEWYWGDGDSSFTTISYNAYSYHTYAVPGTYDVVHITIDGSGCRDTATLSITVTNPCPTHQLNAYLDYNGLFNYSLDVSNVDYFGYSYQWDFGDGTSLNCSNYCSTPVHHYLPGTYDISLVLSSGVCLDSLTTHLEVDCPTNLSDFTLLRSGPSISFQTNYSAYVDSLTTHWDFGDGTVGNQNLPYHVYAQPGIYNVCCIRSYINTNCSDTFCMPVKAFVFSDTASGYVFYDRNGNGFKDTGEIPESSYYVTYYLTDSFGQFVSSGMVYPDSNGYYEVYGFSGGSCDLWMYDSYPGGTYSIPTGGTYYAGFTLPGQHLNIYNFGLTGGNSNISIGTRFTPPFGHSPNYYAPYELVRAGNYYSVTNGFGYGAFSLPHASYNVNRVASGFYKNYSSNPVPYFSDSIINIGGDNVTFQIYSDSSYSDLATYISSSGNPRPGHPVYYNVLVFNPGSRADTFNVNFRIDPAFDYLSSSASNGSTAILNSSTHILTSGKMWAGPGESITLFITLQTNTALPGDYVFHSAYCSGPLLHDEISSNDTDYIGQVVVNSYDPNYKEAEPAGIGPLHKIYNDREQITYTVHFENTGTAPALNVFVQDTIDPNLDLESFQFIEGSGFSPSQFSYNTVHIDGPVVTFSLFDIRLPYTGQDTLCPTCSQGYVQYSVRLKPGLPVGTEVCNKAFIYFDNNAAIITNEVCHTVGCLEKTEEAYSMCSGQSHPVQGLSVSTAGVHYAYTSAGQFACDTMVALRLTVYPPDTTIINIQTCGNSPYGFGATVLDSSGNYIHTFQTSSGCDSVVNLQLSVSSNPSASYSTAICYGSSYSFYGTNLDTAGIYTRTLGNAGGCDSIITLQLNVEQTSSTSFSETIGSDSSYYFNGTWLNSAGAYNDTLLNQAGCDSVITLTLNVITGISSLDVDEQLKIYPNPALNELNISDGSGQEFSAALYDMQDRIVAQNQSVKGKIKLDLHQLSTGIYLMRASTSKGEVKQKIVKW